LITGAKNNKMYFKAWNLNPSFLLFLLTRYS